MMQLLNDCASAQGFGVLLVTHDSQVAARGAHRVRKVDFMSAALDHNHAP